MIRTQDADFRDQIVALLPRLRRFAFTLTSNRQDADDLVQAACERALSRQHQWRPGSRLDSWMFRILYTRRIDMTRSGRSRNVHAPLEEETIPLAGANPKNQIEANTLLRQVIQSMDRLSANDRAVLALVCIEGFSYKESAETLEVPVGTVMSRLARARRRLGELVNPQEARLHEA